MLDGFILKYTLSDLEIFMEVVTLQITVGFKPLAQNRIQPVDDEFIVPLQLLSDSTQVTAEVRPAFDATADELRVDAQT